MGGVEGWKEIGIGMVSVSAAELGHRNRCKDDWEPGMDARLRHSSLRVQTSGEYCEQNDITVTL